MNQAAPVEEVFEGSSRPREASTFDPAPEGTRTRWSCQVETPGAMMLLAQLVLRIGRRQERRVWNGLNRLLKEQAPDCKTAAAAYVRLRSLEAEARRLSNSDSRPRMPRLPGEP